jgi:DNA-directed RNA polymerase subunit alpha
MKFLEPIQMPEKVEFDESTYSSTFGRCEIGPLEPGFATTIGNTLRRVLLSSIQGTAVKYVKIEGLNHEFLPIPGSDSDYVDLILRIKQLVLKSDSIEDEVLVLEHKGKGIITAASIQETPGVKIINKDLFLLELTEDVDFRMELGVGNGRGYVPAEKQNIEDKAIGNIPIDSIYSPIVKVNFEAKNQRVGDRTDYDKLVMEIHTNGSIEPKDALSIASKILRDLFDKLITFEEEPQYIEKVEMDPELERMEKILNMNVNELELSVRCSNCLAAAKIEKIHELVDKTENEMLKYRNFGKKSLEEVTSLLEKYDLSLGMDTKEIFKKIEEAKKKVTTK